MSSLGFYSTENSSDITLTNIGDSFLGRYVSTLDYSEIDITVKIDSTTYTLLVEFSVDGNESAQPDKIVTILGTLTPPIFVNLHKVQPFFKFVRIRVTNTGDVATYTSINTILKSTLTYEDGSSGASSNVVIVNPLVDGRLAVNSIENVSQIGVKGNLQIATFNPLASTNAFDTTGYATSILTYQDTSPLNTGDMLIFASKDTSIPDNEVAIGKLIPIVNANGTHRYASTTLDLRPFNYVWVQNNSTTNTNTNSIISLFSY